MKVKVSDFIFDHLASKGLTDVFMISGGGAMHLVDSVGKNTSLTYYCPLHEQAAAIAAEGYTRVSGKPGVVVVTSGPGGTNTLTGVIGQWADSIPCIYLSGQVKRETTIAHYPGSGLRQIGDQEINIIDIVKPVTKYCAQVVRPEDIAYQLEKAMDIATTGRPGPVWLDIPLDVQASTVETSNLKHFNAKELRSCLLDGRALENAVRKTVSMIRKAERPVIVAGHGIRCSGSSGKFIKLINELRVPVLTTFNGFDIIGSDHELFIGRVGTVGTRAGNFAFQNADLILTLGSRNNIRQVGYSWKSVGRAARKIVVDIDAAELRKPTYIPDLPVNADVSVFMDALSKELKGPVEKREWLEWCKERKGKYPVVTKEDKYGVDPYLFVQKLTGALDNDAIVVAGNGTACVSLFQAGKIKSGQRMFWNSGCASMGYDLPAAIGACIASGRKDVICLAGDGSLQMNLQELQTLVSYGLSVKVFVLNNSGYLSIKQTQDQYFDGRRFACDRSCGVSFPDITKVAESYGIPAAKIESHELIEEKIKAVLESKGPILCEVTLDPERTFEPKVLSEKLPDGTLAARPLEDMWPLLDRDEFRSNMLVPEWDGRK